LFLFCIVVLQSYVFCIYVFQHFIFLNLYIHNNQFPFENNDELGVLVTMSSNHLVFCMLAFVKK